MGVYNNYSQRLSNQIKARFLEIEAIYNFQYGDEFEIAVCQLLSSILPDKYGICRGFVISQGGQTAGDDIIIYDKLSYPVIRQIAGSEYSLKQQVPIESVYAYIECKNAILDQKTLVKAIDQVQKVKELLLTREMKPNPDYDEKGPIYNGRPRDWPRQEPMHVNQPFTMIFTRSWDTTLKIDIPPSTLTPDLMILGDDYIASQTVNLGPDGIKSALFFDSKYWASLDIEKANGKSYGIGMMLLFQALNMIDLIKINWYRALNAELSPFYR